MSIISRYSSLETHITHADFIKSAVVVSVEYIEVSVVQFLAFINFDADDITFPVDIIFVADGFFFAKIGFCTCIRAYCDIICQSAAAPRLRTVRDLIDIGHFGIYAALDQIIAKAIGHVG